MRLLLGISVFWLALSMLSDGITTLLLPNTLLGLVDDSRQATILGLLTAGGLLVGMLVQPVAGMISDQVRDRRGRRFFLALGGGLILGALLLLQISRPLVAVAAVYVFVITAVNIAQAAQQGFIPDLVRPTRRGLASGWKGFMDLGGALLGFVIVGQFVGTGQNRLALLTMGAVVVVTLLLTVALVDERRSVIPNAAPPRPISPFQIDFRQHRPFLWLIASRFLFLLGTYAIGRFFLLFIAFRLNLAPDEATVEAGGLLAGLTAITVLAALPAGWAADRFGRPRLMIFGAATSALGALAFIFVGESGQILLFGGLLSIGSAAYAGANWALTADFAPPAEAARFLGLANFGTAGAAVAAGLFGPGVDWANGLYAGRGYTLLFVTAAVLFLGSAVVLRGVVPKKRRSDLKERSLFVE